MEHIAKKLQEKIAKVELPKFLENPEKYVYNVYCEMLSEFTVKCGVEEVEAKDLEIFTDQPVKELTSEIKTARKEFTKISDDLMKFFNNFEHGSDNRNLLKKMAEMKNSYDSFSYVISRFLLLMDFARSACFVAIVFPKGKTLSGEELVQELFVYNLKVVKEFVKIFNGDMNKTSELMDKARDNVEGVL